MGLTKSQIQRKKQNKVASHKAADKRRKRAQNHHQQDQAAAPSAAAVRHTAGQQVNSVLPELLGDRQLGNHFSMRFVQIKVEGQHQGAEGVQQQKQQHHEQQKQKQQTLNPPQQNKPQRQAQAHEATLLTVQSWSGCARSRCTGLPALRSR
ncbi:hypothetical protein COO60DRAFT_698899 [Scenedesmus sp. NREL 46B-D3]|nr:hypothetical protein COO60DRAFT_698899 [Scenedesmus sp. NREL 46B-D3]